jgi:hypothetical protein
MLRAAASLVTVCVALFSASVRAAPCAGFTDVDDASGPTAGFCADVAWIRNRGVTLGCTPTTYCPFEPVLRIQMAAFMHRLGEALFPSTCASGQVMKWNGTTWTCANDNGGGSGTVTSVAAGTGLQGSPNPITGAGALNLAASYQLPQACTNGQVAKSNGAGGWTCAADNGSGTVTSVATGTGLTGGPITTTGTIAVNTATIQARVSGTCTVGSSIRAINADGTVVCETDDNTGANAFVQGGNAFNAPAVLGTTDAHPLDIIVGNFRVTRYEYNTISPAIVGGSDWNAAEGVRGATIGGGGTAPEFFNPDPSVTGEGQNIVFDAYGTVGGGLANVAGQDTNSTLDQPFATVGGGKNNTARASYSTVAGGRANLATGFASAIGGGESNEASGNWSTIAGGFDNSATSIGATVAGGRNNTASGLYSTVLGGRNNIASGEASTALGQGNTASGRNSLVAGVNARADADECVVFGLWGASGAQMNCLGAASIFRIGATNGFSVDYNTQRPDGGGERWVYIGNGFNGRTIDTWNGAHLTDGGAWVGVSDRAAKDGFLPVDAADVLARVAALPLSSWSYKVEGPNVRHVGPTAQDFRAAFGLGMDDRTMSTLDASGVALAAIQGLHAMLKERDAEIASLKAKLAEIMVRLERNASRATYAAQER